MHVNLPMKEEEYIFKISLIRLILWIPFKLIDPQKRVIEGMCFAGILIF